MEKIVIEVIKTEGGVYMARVKDARASCCGYGKTSTEAIGELIRNNPTFFPSLEIRFSF